MREILAAETNLEEQHQLEAVSEVNIDGFNAGSCFSKVGIAPSCEGLKIEKLQPLSRTLVKPFAAAFPMQGREGPLDPIPLLGACKLEK